MKKFKAFLLCFSSLALLAGCGAPSATSSNDVSSEASSNVAESTSKAGESTSKAPSSSSSKASSSSQKPSSSSSKPSSSAGSSITHSSFNQITDNPKNADKDYTIFKSAPEIRFLTNEGLDWATKPNKDSDKPEVPGTISTGNCVEKYVIKDAAAAMKVRGNYTTNYTKKPFRIKFNSKYNLFGLNEGGKYKKWVLLADVKDQAMMRNNLAFYLARTIYGDSTKEWASDATPVHLYLNNQYWGMYLLAEQKEVKNGRVPLPEPADDYQGTDIGYMFELDHYFDEEGPNGDPTFSVSYQPKEWNQHHSGENYVKVEKGYTLGSDLTNPTVQLPFLKNRVEMAYTALYNAAMNSTYQEIKDEKLVTSSETDIEKVLSKTFNIDSFVNMYIIHELACDPDVGYSSFYFTLDMSPDGDKLLTLNNPWDWDSSMGIRHDTIENSKGMYASVSSNPWFALLCKTKMFQDKVAAKWNALMAEKLDEKAIDLIDTFNTTYKNDYAKNFQKWNRHIGNNPETNFELTNQAKNFKSHAEAVTALRTWLTNRFNYLKTTLPYGKMTDNTGGVGGPTTSTGGNQGGGGGWGWNDQGNENGDGPTLVTLNATEIANFKANATKTRLEAEASDTNATIKSVTTDEQGLSGKSYVGDLDGSKGKYMKFTYNASKAGKVLLVAGLSARTNERRFSDMFNTTVNGAGLKEIFNTTIPAGTNPNGRDYHYWTETEVAYIDVNAGANEITLTSTGNATNFDYIDLYMSK